MSSLSRGTRCPECNAIMVRVWNRLTGQLVYYRCLGCTKKFIRSPKDKLGKDKLGAELIEITPTRI